MIIKKIKAPTYEQAYELMRQSIGSKAVILHSRYVKEGGWLGFFKKEVCQLTIGIEEQKQRTHLHESTIVKEVQSVKPYIDRLEVTPTVKKGLALTAKMIEDRGVIGVETIYNQMLQAVLKPQTAVIGEKRICCVLGPTGVGKTTTVAKLAAHARYDQGKSIAFITLDTFRIAAVEQLKKYSEILDCPCHVAYDASELTSLCNNVTADRIFIDTPGDNYLQSKLADPLVQFLTTRSDVECHVALSLTMKSSDLEQLLKPFSSVTIDSFILTKKDETRTMSLLTELLYKRKEPISCVTTGQHVPNDLCYPTAEQLIGWLRLEGEHNGSSV
ncbi:hypothetical protein [Shouchella hunanensis]|uniref:Flagellar biosynthesis protein FlhF n=1 Tax=Shouchella hunanensis TaxID=766894 RepID=A0ABY7W4Z6_9BACI|nr:hypothetical protein [Shouchella hunanensis]WDF03753.1 hypothetical protein PQ477_20050 [Shouchella hunanensis]